MKIPDDVVIKAADAFKAAYDADERFSDQIRAAVQAGIDWERDQCARIAKIGWLNANCGTIGDADYGNALCEEIEAMIRARNSHDDP